MTKAELENKLRSDMMKRITHMITEELFTDALVVSASEIAVPLLDAEGNEKFALIKVSILATVKVVTSLMMATTPLMTTLSTAPKRHRRKPMPKRRNRRKSHGIRRRAKRRKRLPKRTRTSTN